MPTVFTAPQEIPEWYGHFDKPSLFLAGSIEQNKAVDWQQEVIDLLIDEQDEFYILNPRRFSWDTFAHDDLVRAQVRWELNALERADAIFMFLQPGTISPISIGELGLFAGRNSTGMMINKLIVVCPDGFQRKVNVEEMCARYNVPLFSDFSEGLSAVFALLHKNAAYHRTG